MSKVEVISRDGNDSDSAISHEERDSLRFKVILQLHNCTVDSSNTTFNELPAFLEFKPGPDHAGMPRHDLLLRSSVCALQTVVLRTPRPRHLEFVRLRPGQHAPGANRRSWSSGSSSSTLPFQVEWRVTASDLWGASTDDRIVPVILLERHTAPLSVPKAHFLSPRTLEIFRQYGLPISEIRSYPTKRKDARWIRFVTDVALSGGREIGCLPFDNVEADMLNISPEVNKVLLSVLAGADTPDLAQYTST